LCALSRESSDPVSTVPEVDLWPGLSLGTKVEQHLCLLLKSIKQQNVILEYLFGLQSSFPRRVWINFWSLRVQSSFYIERLWISFFRHQIATPMNSHIRDIFVPNIIC